MTSLPPLDLHAHIDPGIARPELARLPGFVVAMTRTRAEFAAAVERRDPRMIWARGLHPGLVREQRSFDVDAFRSDIARTAMIGEVGLDGSSRVPTELQVENFRAILSELAVQPRIVSIHSARAQARVLRELHRTWVPGVVLHWWTGSAAMTEEAIRLGCYFSVPPASMGSLDGLDAIPLERLLPETDHPFGDRRGPMPRRPGAVHEVETKLARHRGTDSVALRSVFWRNFGRLVDDLRLAEQLPAAWRIVLKAQHPSAHATDLLAE